MNRNTSHLWPWLCTTALVSAMAFVLLGGTDADTYHSASQAAAIKEQKMALRFAKAAIEQCGPGASYTLTDNPGEIQCVQRRTGQPTRIAQVGK